MTTLAVAGNGAIVPLVEWTTWSRSSFTRLPTLWSLPLTSAWKKARGPQWRTGSQIHVSAGRGLTNRSGAYTNYVHPEYRMPEESKEQLDDAVASGARAWEFKGDGLGMSDGHGTFRYYRNLGQERLLKFARRRASV
mgnify:CR=1 FL=1